MDSFCKGLAINKSLVKVDLSYNALPSLEGKYIAEALKENIFLTELNLSHN